MLSLSDPFIDYRTAYVVVIDGKIVGYVQKENGEEITKNLRYLKLTNKEMVIVYWPDVVLYETMIKVIIAIVT